MTESFETIIQAIPTKPYYRDEQADIVIYNADCRSILPLIPDKSIDLVLTDMPYDDFDFGWLEDCFAKLVENGSSYVITDYRSVAELKLALDKVGCFRNWISWCYRRFAPTRRDTPYFIRSHNDILFYSKTEEYQFILPRVPLSESTQLRWANYMTKDGCISENNLTGKLKKSYTKVNLGDGAPCPDWWYFPIVAAGHKPMHEFEKPINLMRRMIEASSPNNDLILDPFLGSGTTAVAAKKLGRKCIGIEISERYARIAVERLRQATLPLEFEQVKQGQGTSESLMFSGET